VRRTSAAYAPMHPAFFTTSITTGDIGSPSVFRPIRFGEQLRPKIHEDTVDSGLPHLAARDAVPLRATSCSGTCCALGAQARTSSQDAV